MPAQNGTAAALMVANGFTGVEDVFSGERDFFFTFAPDADRAELTRGLGHDFEILRAAIKCWTVGGPIQGPLHVLRDLVEPWLGRGWCRRFVINLKFGRTDPVVLLQELRAATWKRQATVREGHI